MNLKKLIKLEKNKIIQQKIKIKIKKNSKNNKNFLLKNKLIIILKNVLIKNIN